VAAWLADALDAREINLAFGMSLKPGDLDALGDALGDEVPSVLAYAARMINKPKKA
jgi:hypothetical protein